MSEPVIQVVNRNDFKNHVLVTLPEDPLPAQLAPSSIRVRTELFTLSTNNFTYARLGHLLGWWDVHPMPPNTPAPYNDTSKYGRLSCWGIGVVTASTSPLAPVGTRLYGYLPLGTLQVDKEITEPEAGIRGQLIETTEHRRHILKGFYNRYMIEPSTATEADLAWDSVMKVLFETSYLIHRYAFTWDPQVHVPVFPMGNDAGTWSAEQADLRDAVVLVFAASSKTAAAFAQQVAVARPIEHRPRKLLAVGSAASKATTRAFGWYDDVLLYTDDALATLQASAELDGSTRVVIVDYGGRDGASLRWASALKDVAKSTLLMAVGSSPDQGMSRGGGEVSGVQRVLGNALGLRIGAMDCLGGAGYFEEFEEAWARFKSDGGLPGIRFDIKDGLEPFYQDWIGLAEGTIPGTAALLYRI